MCFVRSLLVKNNTKPTSHIDALNESVAPTHPPKLILTSPLLGSASFFFYLFFCLSLDSRCSFLPYLFHFPVYILTVHSLSLPFSYFPLLLNLSFSILSCLTSTFLFSCLSSIVFSCHLSSIFSCLPSFLLLFSPHFSLPFLLFCLKFCSISVLNFSFFLLQ